MPRHGGTANRTRTEADGGQLDLFAAGGAVAAPVAATAGNAPPPARRPSPERSRTAAIPPACPVTGTAVCYRGDCRHYGAGACGHPGASNAAGKRGRRPAESA